jgi:hypothetical protein
MIYASYICQFYYTRNVFTEARKVVSGSRTLQGTQLEVHSFKQSKSLLLSV